MFDITQCFKNQVLHLELNFQKIKFQNRGISLISFRHGLYDTYNLCGASSNCIMGVSHVCQCVEGFRPVSLGKADQKEWSRGCVGSMQWSCKDKDKIGFVKFSGLKMPATTYSWLNESMNLNECRVKCQNNCSCTASANSYIRDEIGRAHV